MSAVLVHTPTREDREVNSPLLAEALEIGLKGRILVTGASGFVGKALQAYMGEIEAGHGHAKLEIVPAPATLDVCDYSSVLEAVRDAGASHVIHLAARTSVPESISDPASTYAVNFNGTLNVLTALREVAFRGRFLYVSSGDVYGMVPVGDLPIREERLPAPRSPYAVSKAAAELLCGQWERSHDADIVICRPFNHIGPGQDRRFATADFAAQLVGIKRGQLAPVLNVGNIDVTRDFLDVRDVLRAYFLLLERGRRGAVYNVCSGKERSLRSIIELFAARLELDVEIRPDPARIRANEQTRVVGSPEKLIRDTGWAPRETLEDTADRIISYWGTQTT